MTTTYKLTKTELKNGKFLYQVIDNQNNLISTRTSSRNYIACNLNGDFYFGRLDLINKGTFKNNVEFHLNGLNITENDYMKLVQKGVHNISYVEYMNEITNSYLLYSTIAYL